MANSWLAFYYLHDISNMLTKFDNNRSGSFEDYHADDSKKHFDGNGRPIFSYSWGHETSGKLENGQYKCYTG